MLASVGVRPSVRGIGSGVPHDEVIRLLINWSRWAARWRPHQGVQPPPWAQQWYPHLAWDSGWGDQLPLEAIPDEIDDAEAVRIDKAVMGLAVEHVLVLKHRYIDQPRRYETRERVDAAIRALGDALV